MGSGFSFFVLTHKLQLELIPYGSDTFSARGFTEEVLQPHYERIMSVICAHPRRYILFCGSVFEVLFDGYIVDQHEFRLRKKDGSFTRQRARFANCSSPFEEPRRLRDWRSRSLARGFQCLPTARNAGPAMRREPYSLITWAPLSRSELVQVVGGIATLAALPLRRRELTGYDGREVEPVLLPGAEIEPALDSTQDEAELAVLDSVDEDDPGVWAASGGPLSEDLGEVSDVVRDENATVVTRQREHVLVVESLQLGLLVEGPDVVSHVPKRSTDPQPRDVGVEQEAHRVYSGISRKG